MRHKIFVSAYACEPGLGSEIGVGWHWVLEMSKYFELWVLTRKSNQSSIDQWFAENQWEHKINFVYFDLPKKLRFWKRGLRGVRTYYVLWQKLTNRIVRSTMQQHGIEIYHLLTYGNALWPASSYGQKQTFVWGPTTVGSYVDKEFSKHYGFKNRAKEALQRLMAKTLFLNRGFYARCRDARLILCKTEQTRVSIPEKYRHKAVVFTDVAVELFETTQYKCRRTDNSTRFLAVGRLESWRGFDMLIEAFAKAVEKDKNLHLDIIGKGSDKERLRAMIHKLRLSTNVKLAGQVSMQEYYQYMADCEVVVNPTLKEGAVTTAFDSMSFTKPLICVNTGGYTRYFNNNYAIVLDRTDRETITNNLCEAMLRLTNKDIRTRMSTEIMSVRNDFIWEQKGQQIRDIILASINQ